MPSAANIPIVLSTSGSVSANSSFLTIQLLRARFLNRYLEDWRLILGSSCPVFMDAFLHSVERESRGLVNRIDHEISSGSIAPVPRTLETGRQTKL